MQDKKTFSGRIGALDLYRGIALVCVIFFHNAIFNYGGLHTVNLAEPSPLIVIIGLMGLWGGIFITLSLVTSTMSILRRLADPDLRSRVPLYIVLTSVAYMLLHYLLTFFLGRWELNPATTENKLTLPAEILRNRQVPEININAFFDGSILSTISLNLLLIGMVIYFLFRKPSVANEKRAYVILSVLAMIMVLVSFNRIELFPLIQSTVSSGNYIGASILGWFLGFPYPILSYAVYGVVGALVGIMVYHQRLDYIRRFIIPLGLLFLTIGVIGCLSQPMTFNKPDMFWQWKSIADLGVFTLLLVLALGIVEPKQNGYKKWTIFIWFSRVSLTIYLLETTVSEILRHAMFVLLPSWDQNIPSTLLFSLFNVLFWLGVVYLWSRFKFRYSLEYFWTQLFNKVGLKSKKLDEIPYLNR